MLPICNRQQARLDDWPHHIVVRCGPGVSGVDNFASMKIEVFAASPLSAMIGATELWIVPSLDPQKVNL